MPNIYAFTFFVVENWRLYKSKMKQCYWYNKCVTIGELYSNIYKLCRIKCARIYAQKT